MIFDEEPLLCGDEHNTQTTLERTETLYDLLEKIGKDVVHLGDIFHTKEKLSSKALNLIFKKLSASKLKHVILVGNHDYHSLECKEHSLEVLKNLPNVLIVDKPTQINFGSINALAMPYYHDLNKFKHDISTHGRGMDLLLMHQGVTGFDYGNGFIAVDELDLEALVGFKKVVSGHFHKYQENGLLTFLGTPYSQDFGESNQVKYLGVLKKDLSIQLYETDFPKHLTEVLDLSELSPEDFPPLRPRDFQRFILKGTKEEVERFPEENYPGVKLIPRVNHNIESIIFSDKSSNEEKFQKWAEANLNTETLTLGIEILSEVR